MATTDAEPTSTKQKRVLNDRERLQRVFSRMKQVCLDSTFEDYHNYGGRGIYICQEWLASGTSEEFVQWALANGYQQGLDTDRIDNNGPYAPWNVRFVTRKENSRNIRRNVYVEYQGEQMLLVALVEQRLGDSTSRIFSRIYRRVERGWDIEVALTTPNSKEKSRS